MIAPGQLEERICAFVDILGFSNFVNGLNAATGADREHKLAQLIKVNDQFEEERSRFTKDLRRQGALTYFSDNIFLSIPVSRANAFELVCHYIDRICTALLIDGFLTRGAIVRGLIYHVENTVFGPAIVDASGVEKAVARFPRVVVKRNAVPEKFDNSDARLLACDDGPICLNPLHQFESFVQRLMANDRDSYMNSDNCRKRLSHLGKIRAHLERHFHTTRDRPDVHEKVRWMVLQLNTRVLTQEHGDIAQWPRAIAISEILPPAG